MLIPRQLTTEDHPLLLSRLDASRILEAKIMCIFSRRINKQSLEIYISKQKTLKLRHKDGMMENFFP